MKEKFQTNFFYVDGYTDLFFTIKSLMNVCLLALEADATFTSPLIRNPETDIYNVLETARKLIPY